MPSVAIVATSADLLKDHPTGAWSEEITGPFYVFKDKKVDVTFFSVKGGKVPIDAGSLSENFVTENDKRFEQDDGPKLLETTRALGDLKADDFDCVFFAGGHGTVVDFPDACGTIASEFYAKGKVVGAVCHGPTALYNATKTKDGVEEALVKGMQVAGFTDKEEEQVGLLKLVDDTPESKMKKLGAEHSCGEPWTPHAVRDGTLVTGQNPQSSVKTAELCLEALGN
mmetsp:Transcript_23779/g.71437  ORF Transcript_23779/g.71437 Transcript_23779/m.71437 type:complete len:226 (-) Transcript_23779:58-735(-)